MPFTMILLISVVLSYPLLWAIGLRLTQGTRDEFADLVRSMLVDPNVSEAHKIFISEMIDDVFDWRFMARASFVFPVVVFSRRAERDLSEQDRAFFETDAARRLISLHMRSVMVASPLFTVIFFVVAAFTLILRLCTHSMTTVALVWADTVKDVSPKSGLNSIGNLARL